MAGTAGSGRRARLSLIIIAASGLFAVAMWHGAHADASSKGSSCSDPYRVTLNVPTDTAHNNHGVEPGSFYGDTSYIEASGRGEGTTNPNVDYFVVSWKPRVGGLKLCEARITFRHRQTFVSHQWHRTPIKIEADPQLHVAVISFTVTAAR